LEDLEVISVVRENKKVKRVIISIDVFSVSFIEKGGKILKENVDRLDGVRVCDDDDLWLPLAYYKRAHRRACAIFGDKNLPR